MQKTEFTEYFEQMAQIFSRFQKLSSALDQFEQKYMDQEQMQLENEAEFEIQLEEKPNQKITQPFSSIEILKKTYENQLKGEKHIQQSSKLKKKQTKQISQQDNQKDKRKASYIDYEG